MARMYDPDTDPDKRVEKQVERSKDAKERDRSDHHVYDKLKLAYC